MLPVGWPYVALEQKKTPFLVGGVSSHKFKWRIYESEAMYELTACYARSRATICFLNVVILVKNS